MVGDDERDPQPAGEDAEKIPADERKIEQEHVHLVPFGHHPAEIERALVRHFGVFREQVGDHRIFIALDDSRDDQREIPERKKQAPQQLNHHDVSKVLAVAGKQHPDIGAPSTVDHHKAVLSDFEDIGHEAGNAKSNGQAQHRSHRKNTADQRPGNRIGIPKILNRQNRKYLVDQSVCRACND